MKRTFWMSLMVGLAVAASTLEAKTREPDRARRAEAGPARLLLVSQPAILVDSGYESPPPAPAFAIPTSPLPPAAVPMRDAGLAAAGGPPIAMAPAAALYPCVKYKDRRKIAPCAVPMCVAVRDPCTRKHGSCCEVPKCVLVEICVPPCGAPRITSRHDGTKVRYDYGKYAVNITSRHGVVVVNYDD